MGNRTRSRTIAALAAVAALSLGGCSGSDSGTDSAAADRESAQGSASPDPGDTDASADPVTDLPDEDFTTPASPTTKKRNGNKPKRSEVPKDSAPKKKTPAPSKTATPSPTPAPKPAKKPTPTYLVSRVIDGDTVELGNGQGVRVVGIDTPERGECGFDAATANMIRLVEGKRVRLSQPDEDTDRYGRLLRYLNIGDVDPGLRQIKDGLAIARYDSRDGYGYHPREPVYIAADKANGNIKCAAPASTPAPQPATPAKPGGNCASGYSPCIPPYPPDVNCSDVQGPIAVTGSDPHGLDADGDGVACES